MESVSRSVCHLVMTSIGSANARHNAGWQIEWKNFGTNTNCTPRTTVRVLNAVLLLLLLLLLMMMINSHTSYCKRVF